MSTCCFCLSIRTGCLIGSFVFLTIAITKILLLILLPLPEGPETVISLNVVLLTLAGVLLLVGVTKEDRVCIIIFICFNVCAMVLQALGLLIVYLGNTNDTVAQWILVMLIVEHIPFLYMIPIGVIEYRIIKETHLQIADNYSRSALRMSAPHAGQVPGLGF